MLFGRHAVRIPLNIVVQYQGDVDGRALVLVVGQSTFEGVHPLCFGSNKTHQLILGDAVIRPHIVFDSNAFQGRGLNGLIQMSPDEWLDNPHGILLNNVSESDKRMKR